MSSVSIPPRSDNAVDTDLDLAARLGLAWRQIRRGAAVSTIRDRIYGIGASALEPGQMDALDHLVSVQQCRMSDLASALGVDPSTATRAVQRLIKDGLVEHVSHSGDARVVVIGATTQGIQRHAEVAERRRQVLVAVLDEFAPDEREQLADHVERFAAAIDALAKRKRWPTK